MGPNSAAELNAWLREGGVVVTASDRAARAIAAAYHRGQQSAGLMAWAAPRVLDWKSFIRTEWEEHRSDSSLLLNRIQEQSLWSEVIAGSGSSAALLEGPRRRLAELAMEAHELLCLYAPRLLKKENRASWQRDAGAFGQWLTAFDAKCRQLDAVSPARLALELLQRLEADTTTRPSLLLAGFDRMVPTQRKLFEVWGPWKEFRLNTLNSGAKHYAAPDEQLELHACARWCRDRVQADPNSRILVITSDAAKRRGEMERAFLEHAADSSVQFEFSLGVPLGSIALARTAHAVLRWLDSSLQEHEVDWLLSSSYSADPQESLALQGYMRALRRRGLQRTQWSLRSFLQQPSGNAHPPASWSERMLSAQQLIRNERTLTPLDWAALMPRVLESAGWPTNSALSSSEFQAFRSWQQAVDTCGTLAIDGRRIGFRDFLADLGRVLDETLFAAESEQAPILIAGPAESAGLTADAVWFLGTDEDAWPARGAMHPLLPAEIQRSFQMPHASAQLDWNFAQAITTRLLSSASEVHFSYARQKDGIDARPSRLVTQLSSTPEPLPTELQRPSPSAPLTIASSDLLFLPFPFSASGEETVQIRGGSTVLTSQSQCPFKAFAIARLDAQGWDPAEAGLSAALRGQLLHAVLHAIWAGPPRGLRALDDLRALPDLTSFVSEHVRNALQENLPAGAREQMPTRYLELEEQRLTMLISEWLRYESCRQPFTVDQTEVDTVVQVSGLSLKLRLDRVDRLNDDSLLVIDYKTGDVSPKSWELPRPEDVQLPLYAGFALAPDQELGGLAFAKARAGDTCFAGRVGDPVGTLRADLKGTSTLVKNPLTLEQLLAWRDTIEQLARDFLAGRADVDPREYPQTCDRCGLQTICRIQERESFTADDEDFAEVNHG